VNRRQLLALLAGSAGALAAGEIWTPSRKIFLPPMDGWPRRIESDPRLMTWADIAKAARVPIERIDLTISPAEWAAAKEYFARMSDARIYIDG
jgi:hypothetical protein